MFLFLAGLILSIVGVGYIVFFAMANKSLAAAFGLIMAYLIYKSLRTWNAFYRILRLYKVGEPINFLVTDKAIWLPIIALSPRWIVHYRHASGPYLRVPWNAIEGMEIYEFYAKEGLPDWMSPRKGNFFGLPNTKFLTLHLQLRAVADILETNITPLEFTQIELTDALERHGNKKVKCRSMFDDLKITW